MDPNKPPLPGTPAGIQKPEEALFGRGRSLLLPSGDASLGRGRGFEPLPSAPGGQFGRGLIYPSSEPATGLARGLPLPSDDGGLGRARGLFLQAAQPSVGLGRAAPIHTKPSVIPPSEVQLTKPASPQGMPSLQEEEEEASKKSLEEVHLFKK